MKKIISPLTIIICLMIFSSARAEITWTTTEFSYSIDNNSTFLYSQIQYYKNYIRHISKTSIDYDPYDSVAEDHVSEFQDIPEAGSGFQIDAMAMGPENGTDPPNGLMVQAFLSTAAQGLNNEQGVDTDMQVFNWIVRKFTVNQPETYTVQMNLTGITDFNNFYINDDYQAWYTIQTEITLEKITGTGDDIINTAMPGFPVHLDESNRSASVAAQLKPVDDELNPITYRIKAQIKLISRINNMTLDGWTIHGDVNGNYKLGSSESPFTIVTSLYLGSNGDSDQDGISDDLDNCPNDSNADQLDDDGDGFGNVCDGCPEDPVKNETGICGCGTPDTDSDADGTVDCEDSCPSDPNKVEPGVCGCGVQDTGTDSDGDGTVDCLDAFPNNPDEWLDTDHDGIGNNSDPDDDGDGMPDEWENQYGLDPLINDAEADFDQDGWTNYQEFQKNTDPTDPNSHPKKGNLAPIIQLLLLSENTYGVDLDKDGYLASIDCNDNDPDVNPGASEIPYNGKDDDCNAATPDDDLDQDGYLVAEDCDDSDPDVNPGAIEIANNGKDDDCNPETIDEIACSDYMIDGCHLPTPDQLVASIDTETTEGTYVNFSWSAVDCAEGYAIAIGTSPNLIGDPDTIIITRTLPSYRADFSNSEARNYYWAVASKCNKFTSEAGEWSTVQIFEFN